MDPSHSGRCRRGVLDVLFGIVDEFVDAGIEEVVEMSVLLESFQSLLDVGTADVLAVLFDELFRQHGRDTPLAEIREQKFVSIVEFARFERHILATDSII
jgi:hypothetical protein